MGGQKVWGHPRPTPPSNTSLSPTAFLPEAAEPARMYDDVLLPTDGSDASLVAKLHAVDHARRYDATLHVVFVADTGRYSTLTSETDVEGTLVGEGQRVVTDLAAEAEAEGVDVEGAVLEGHPREKLLGYAREVDADLVVMATHGRDGAERVLLGSTTERVLRESEVPVLAVPRPDAEE